MISTNLVTNLLLSLFCQARIKFSGVGGLVTINIPVFCTYRVALYVKAMPNSENEFSYMMFLVVL